MDINNLYDMYAQKHNYISVTLQLHIIHNNTYQFYFNFEILQISPILIKEYSYCLDKFRGYIPSVVHPVGVTKYFEDC